MVKFLWVQALFLSGALRLSKWRVRARGGAIVLTFHRVLPDGEYRTTSSLPGIVIREQTFARLMRYLQRHCEPMRIADCARPPGAPRPRVRVLMTFDDGWLDTFAVAFPIAKQSGVPLVVFVCPGLAGRRFPFWPERAAALWRGRNGRSSDAAVRRELESFIEQLKAMAPDARAGVLRRLELASPEKMPDSEPWNATMAWAQMHELQDAGVVFGAHSRTHQILTEIPLAEAESEIASSQREIQQELRARCELFAYPNGNWSEEIRRLVAESGYRWAFTTEPGVWEQDTDPLRIPRINISEDKVVGWGGQFSRAMFEYSVFWRHRRGRAAKFPCNRSDPEATPDGAGNGR